jgi:hypothetical protein
MGICRYHSSTACAILAPPPRPPAPNPSSRARKHLPARELRRESAAESRRRAEVDGERLRRGLDLSVFFGLPLCSDGRWMRRTACRWRAVGPRGRGSRGRGRRVGGSDVLWPNGATPRRRNTLDRGTALPGLPAHGLPPLVCPCFGTLGVFGSPVELSHLNQAEYSYAHHTQVCFILPCLVGCMT